MSGAPARGTTLASIGAGSAPPRRRSLPSWSVTLFFYLLRALATSTAFAIGALGFIVFPAVAVSAVHKLGGVSLGAVLRYIPMIGIQLTPYLVSLGFLLAVVSTFGRLAADREWIALQMAGVHPARVLLPGAIVAGVLAAGTIWLIGTLSPQWSLEKDNFRANMLVQTLRNLAPGRTEFDIGRFYLSARGRDGAAFTEVQIRVPNPDPLAENEILALVADRVDITFDDTFMYMALTDVRTVNRTEAYFGGGNGGRIPLDLIFQQRAKDETRAKYRTTGGMLRDIEDGVLEPEMRSKYAFEVHQRWSLGATYFLFLLIGMPTGLWLRAGTQLTALGAASVYAFAYYIFSLRLGQSLAEKGVLPPELAAWSTTGIALVIGVLMQWRLAKR
jgi:lipopolysaccharide export LptBFGC system permease protein LptF